MKVSLRALFYLLYAVLLTGVLLYVRFPVAKFKRYCEHRLEQMLGQAQCTIAEIDYSFPATIEFKNVKISSFGDGKDDTIVLDLLRMSPEFKSLFTTWKIEGELYSGEVHAELTASFGDKFFSVKDISCSRIDIAGVMRDLPSFARKISGKLMLSGEYKANFAHPQAGYGKGNVQIDAGTLQLFNKIFSLDEIDFKKIRIDWEYKEGMFRLLNGKMSGKQLDADFTGTFQHPFLSDGGSLNISGLITPEKTFIQSRPKLKRLVKNLMQKSGKSAVSFSIGGTLQKPTLRLTR